MTSKTISEIAKLAGLETAVDARYVAVTNTKSGRQIILDTKHQTIKMMLKSVAEIVE